MKNVIKNLFIKVIPIVVAVFMTVSCEQWLDVVPDNLPTLGDAFTNRATARKYLFTCYSYLPDPVHPWSYPAYFTSRDEFEHGTFEGQHDLEPVRIARGEQNSNSPLLNYWSGGAGITSLFMALRSCNIFLEGIHEPRDMTEEERSRWIAEVKFLKAYYHFFLLQLYGPVPIIDENIPLSASPEEVRIFREPVDECIDYIVKLIDEAVPDLPIVIVNKYEEYGRITKPIALSIKAKALVWAASPLFNGNPDYRSWRDSRGKQLISDTYDREKWVTAATAIRTAIDACHEAGNELYRYDKTKNSNTANMSDSLAVTMTVRNAVSEKWNDGVVWASTAPFGSGKAPYGPAYQPGLSDFQLIIFPALFGEDFSNTGISRCNASFDMAELFYTNKGIPINEDPDWDYNGRYQLKTSTVDAGNGLYIAIGQQTAALNFDREPRFYGNLTFDRGFLEIATATTNRGASFAPYIRARVGEPANYIPLAGYYIKKLIAFETTSSEGLNRPYRVYDYRFPLIRLADLYLLYSEVLNEVKEAPDAEVYEWIDRVREVTGLKGVVESWKNSRYPNRPADKDEMRKIIQQERMIELAFEGQRFWDVRRWKLAENLWTVAPRAWNYAGRTADAYYNVINWADPRKFMFRDYLWPISLNDLSINKNLVQTYGW